MINLFCLINLKHVKNCVEKHETNQMRFILNLTGFMKPPKSAEEMGEI